ncbi:hypothetical protein [Rhodobaculum claviforme]|uniref:Uncharacterized protein n=1 Tax=Rhodobaculum claviforme TaxID=1549854 RepID=A0A934TP48_9RHOB|nr:hypothetical protein [Rhodobaculum claviforme]MBK5928653.1 hypothetical protein [Rhodobaculum claviforme]
MSDTLDADAIAALFTRSDGSYLCARWGRPVVPVVFGVGDASLPVFKGAFEALGQLSGHPVAETDPELGANLMVFMVRDWAELAEVPGLERLIPDLVALLDRLTAAEANQYRIFRFDAAGGIKAAFVLLRLDAHLAAVPAEVLALAQATQTWLLWSDTAFADAAPLAQAGGRVILRPDIAGVIRAAYDPVLPVAATDPAHALRLAARITAPQ